MDVSALDFWTIVGAAVLCGMIIGFERQIQGKPAGIRTSVLICLGSSLFVALGVEHTSENTDATRVLGQIVTGIGFLGAGVILAREGIVIGVTSVATIWVLAAVGAMIGFERYIEGITIASITVALLVGIGLLEGKYQILRRGVHAKSKNNKKGE